MEGIASAGSSRGQAHPRTSGVGRIQLLFKQQIFNALVVLSVTTTTIPLLVPWTSGELIRRSDRYHRHLRRAYSLVCIHYV